MCTYMCGAVLMHTDLFKAVPLRILHGPAEARDYCRVVLRARLVFAHLQ